MTVDHSLPFTSLTSVILTSAALLVVWTSLKAYVDKRGAFRWADTLLETHQFVAASLSAALAAYVLDIGHNVLHAKTGFKVDPYLLGYLYHLLKIYEYLDILLAILAGNTKVSKYTAFSHVFLPYWSYYRIVARPYDSTDWRFQVIGDCLARFASRAIPWLIEDVTTEQSLLVMAEEGRWYPDLSIAAFWAFFTFQDQRQDEQAIKSFGPPYKDEALARILGVAILLYAAYACRQEEAERKKDPEVRNKNASTPKTANSPEVSSGPAQRTVRQGARKAR